jgi:hypothetical protein
VVYNICYFYFASLEKLVEEVIGSAQIKTICSISEI